MILHDRLQVFRRAYPQYTYYAVEDKARWGRAFVDGIGNKKMVEKAA